MQLVLSDASRSENMVKEALRDLESAPADTVPHRAETARFLGALEQFLATPGRDTSAGSGGLKWQPLEIEAREVRRAAVGPSNPFDITFPQGILWGIIGSTMAFSIGIVSERAHGTFVRLRMAPLSRAQLLAGKAVACFSAIMIVETLLMLVGAVFFRVRPGSPGLLVLAGASSALAFVGIMMLAAAAGKTEQAAAGVGWAVMLPLAMLGGGMIPLFIMPSWLASASKISPVRWAIIAIEGALWRGFTLREMLLPCGVLLAVGIVCFAIGTRVLRTE
jgi:ABC-2 type transport system permease protein